MITKEEAYKIAVAYLKEKNRSYSSLDKVDEVGFIENKEIIYGNREGEMSDMFIITYGELWGFEERSFFIKIDAETGEVLYTLTPHGFAEDFDE